MHVVVVTYSADQLWLIVPSGGARFARAPPQAMITRTDRRHTEQRNTSRRRSFNPRLHGDYFGDPDQGLSDDRSKLRVGTVLDDDYDDAQQFLALEEVS